MSSQRQKKRNAQFRKKHHEFKAREGGTGQRKREEAERTAKKPETEEKSKSRDSDPAHQPASRAVAAPVPTSQPQPSAHNREKQYSRRKVVSNWERYAEGGERDAAETEADLERRLVQLLNLPPATPQAKGGVCEDDEEEASLPPPSFLSLDCNALAAALAPLPLHRRLGISLELLALAEDSLHGEDTHDLHGENTQGLHGEDTHGLHGDTAAAAGTSQNVTSTTALMNPVTLDRAAFDFPSPDTFRVQAKESQHGKGPARTSHGARTPEEDELVDQPGPVQLTPAMPQSVTATVPQTAASAPPLTLTPVLPLAVQAEEDHTATEPNAELDDILDELLA